MIRRRIPQEIFKKNPSQTLSGITLATLDELVYNLVSVLHGEISRYLMDHLSESTSHSAPTV